VKGDSPQSVRRYIVCVDDEQAVLNQLSAQLTRGFGSTHVVECTESAEEALSLIEEIFAGGDEVQLVICDQVMPHMKGDRFLETVHIRWPDVMKILLTGQAGLEAAIYAINHAGLHRYIEKPWEAADLTMAIQNLLTQYALRKELALHHERLERRSRELHNLHELWLELGSALEPEHVLEKVASAARAIAGARAAGVLARLSGSDLFGVGLALKGLGPARKALEAHLARHQQGPRSGAPEGLPQGMRAVPLVHSETLFGWILLEGCPDPSPDVSDLLAILAGQSASALNNIQFLSKRLESERLSTIGRMISTIVHDFRNPMTAIKGYSGMLAEFDLSRDRQRECAYLISEEADRMGLMIDEVLEFTRGEPSRLKLVVVTVAELAGKILGLMEPEFRGRGISFQTDLRYPGPLVVDIDRMKRAILNVASNALDAMGPGGVFTFGSRLNEGTVELLLSDTGQGIPEEFQRRIFEPFFTHGKPRGIGLGMSITRRIVEEHGGEVRLESRPGEGTLFILRIPLEPSRPLAGPP
jgi:two-component system chemotaxis response regulator CheY